MSVSRSSVINEAQKVENKVIKICNDINLLLSGVNDASISMKIINNKINENVQADDINNACDSEINEVITKQVNKLSNDIQSFISNIVNDGNKYISDLENNYNASLTEDEPRLYLNRISIKASSIRGDSINSKGKSSIIKTKSTSHTSSAENKTDINAQMDKALSININNTINSNNISDWDNYVKMFLATNNLNSYVSTFRLENGKVICILTNGKQYILEKINSSKDLVNAIRNLS